MALLNKIVYILIFIPFFSFAQWNVVSTVNAFFQNTTFVSPKIGYALGKSSATQNYQVFKTTDSAYTWNSIYTISVTGSISDFNALKDSVWVLTTYEQDVNQPLGNIISVFKSSNEGNTLERIIKIQQEGQQYKLDSILISRDSTVYTDTVIYHESYQYNIGARYSSRVYGFNKDTFVVYKNNGYFLETLDGGVSWDSTKINGKFYGGVSLIVLSFNHYLIWDQKGNFYKTENGKDWHVFTQTGLNYDPGTVDFDFLNPKIGYAMTSMPSYRVFKTTDSSKTWVQISDYISVHFANILGFYNCNTGFISFGGGYYTSGFELYTTNDGGQTLGKQLLPNNFSNSGKINMALKGIVFKDINKITLIASSPELITLIAKTYNGGDKLPKTVSSECLNTYEDCVPYASAPVVSRITGTDSLSLNLGNAVSYVWAKNNDPNPMPDVTRKIKAEKNVVYRARAIYGNNCATKVSNDFCFECDVTGTSIKFSQGISGSIFTYWPNPASSELIISTLSYSRMLKVQIRELSGKVLISNLLELNDGRATVSVKDLTPGVYFITCITDTVVENYKFIKE